MVSTTHFTAEWAAWVRSLTSGSRPGSSVSCGTYAHRSIRYSRAPSLLAMSSWAWATPHAGWNQYSCSLRPAS